MNRELPFTFWSVTGLIVVLLLVFGAPASKLAFMFWAIFGFFLVLRVRPRNSDNVRNENVGADIVDHENDDIAPADEGATRLHILFGFARICEDLRPTVLHCRAEHKKHEALTDAARAIIKIPLYRTSSFHDLAESAARLCEQSRPSADSFWLESNICMYDALSQAARAIRMAPDRAIRDCKLDREPESEARAISGGCEVCESILAAREAGWRSILQRKLQLSDLQDSMQEISRFVDHEDISPPALDSRRRPRSQRATGLHTTAAAETLCKEPR